MRPRKHVVGWILIVAMTSSAMTSSSNHSSVAVLSKRQNANKTQDHWWGCGVSHSAHAAPLREAVAQQAATHMSFNTGGASPKCTLPDQLRLHRQHVHLFAGRHYIDYVQRLSKHFVRVHDEAVHVLFVGVAGAERAMVDDFLKCRDIHVHTLSSESKTSASVAALTGVYGTCPNVHVRDAKALLPADVPPAPAPAPVPSLAAWADRQRLKRFDLVSVNLRPSETLTLLQGMAMSNDTNLERFGNILFRLDSKNTLLAGQQHDPVSGAPGTGAGAGAGNATAAEDARLFDTAKLLVAHGYELYLLKCQFGGGSLQIDAEFFGDKSPTTGGAATWRGAAGDPSATSVLAVHMMYGLHAARSSARHMPCQSLKQSLIAVNSARCGDRERAPFTCGHVHHHGGRRKHGNVTVTAATTAAAAAVVAPQRQ